MKRFLLLLFCFSIAVISCTKDEDIKSTAYETGTFIVNEGPFGSGTGTISHFDGTKITQDIFGIENNGNALGNIVQSMIKMNDKYFISVNNADKIQVVNAKDFKNVGEIANIPLPRYFCTSGNKLYLTSWSRDFSTGAINQIDPVTLKVVSSIPINGLAERVLAKNDLIYIAVNSSQFDILPRNILVFEPKMNTIIDTITVGDNPNDLVSDKNGDIWVICSGFTDWNNPALSTNGSLHRVKNGLSVQNFNLPNGAKGLSIDKSGEKLYYIAGGKVWERSIAGAEKMIVEGNYYAIGLDKKDNKLYVSDALDYQKPGIVSQVDLNTLTKVEFSAGIIPGFFYFNE
jgi:hypothetical protein